MKIKKDIFNEIVFQGKNQREEMLSKLKESLFNFLMSLFFPTKLLKA